MGILKSRPRRLARNNAGGVARTTDFTRGIRISPGNNATSKGLRRRVSFASHAQVRVFTKDTIRDEASPRNEGADMDLTTNGLSGEQPEPTDFRVLLGSSLRRPEPPSTDWRAMKHAGGDSPYEPHPSDAGEDEDGPAARGGGAHLGEEDLDLTEAETRLRRVHDVLGLANIAQEDSFTSSEGESIGYDDNLTINLTNLLRNNLVRNPPPVVGVINVQGTSGASSTEEAINRALPSPPLPDSPAALEVPPEPTSIAPNAASLPQDPTTRRFPPGFKPDAASGTTAFALPQRKKPDEVSGSLLFEGDKRKSPANRQAPPPPPSKSGGTRVLGPSSNLNIPQPTSPQRKAAHGRTTDKAEIGQNMMDFGRAYVTLPFLPLPPQLPIRGSSKGASLSGTRDPPPPTSQQPFMETNPLSSADSEAPAMERTIAFADVEAVEEWRQNIQLPSIAEEDEGVRALLMALYQPTDVDASLG